MSLQGVLTVGYEGKNEIDIFDFSFVLVSRTYMGEFQKRLTPETVISQDLLKKTDGNKQ